MQQVGGRVVQSDCTKQTTCDKSRGRRASGEDGDPPGTRVTSTCVSFSSTGPSLPAPLGCGPFIWCRQVAERLADGVYRGRGAQRCGRRETKKQDGNRTWEEGPRDEKVK